VLPGVKTARGSIAFTVDLSADSSRLATFRLQWQGDSSFAADIPVAAEGGELKLKVTAAGQSVSVSSSAGDKTLTIPPAAGSSPVLVVRVVNPQTARTPVVVLRVLAVREKS
jgi:hypothetical protein